MIYRLKTQDNKLLATVEVGLEHLNKAPNVEIRTFIHIEHYTLLIYNSLIEREYNIVDLSDTFHELSTLRDWMWDDYFASKRNVASELEPIVKHIKDILLAASHEFNLKLE